MKTLEPPGVEEELTRLEAEFCRGLGHPKRIQVLRSLGEGPKSVGALVRETGIPQANLSQHLSILRRLGLLLNRRDGNTVYYSVRDARILDVCDLVRSCVGEQLQRSRHVFTRATS